MAIMYQSGFFSIAVLRCYLAKYCYRLVLLFILLFSMALASRDAYAATIEAPQPNFGHWAVVSEPLYLVLQWIHQHIASNWGWDIVILTLVVNAGLLPLRLRAMRSAARMQQLRPQIQSIQVKYRGISFTDPRRQQMQKEIAELQQSEALSPFGGCVLMLLQMPLLFGFYRMLATVNEFHQAHWLWIKDLSTADPTYLLSAIFASSMFLSQWLTPMAGMDRSQRILLGTILPVVFAAFTRNYAAALTLYWTCSNLVGQGLQFLARRSSPGKPSSEKSIVLPS